MKALLAAAEATDAAEDATYGAEHRGDELPAELKRREDRLARIKEAKRALEARAKAEAEDAGTPPAKAKPLAKAQYNFTDPESRIMKTPDGFAQAYNTQIAVDDLQVDCRAGRDARDQRQEAVAAHDHRGHAAIG